METPITQPSKEERLIADASFRVLEKSIKHLSTDNPEIEIEEIGEKVKIPLNALKLLVQILGKMREGKPFTLLPVASEMTTQAAAGLLNCSRPHVVKLLEEGKMPFTLVGRHRRIKLSDLQAYRAKMKDASRDKVIEIMKDVEDMKLYGS
ncbi:MAG: helix-turn-helix domain-containing protein [Cyclobacteriaceae bacterium]